MIASHAAEAIGEVTGLKRGLTLDLATVSSRLFNWPDAELGRLSEAVSQSNIVLFASPTYKAAYTGILKAFLDRYPVDGLRNAIAIPVMTGASLEHRLAPDTTLRPLLVELGASVPTTSLYFVMTDMDKIHDLISSWLERNRSVLELLADKRASR
jgi:FMN reductase